MSLPFFTARSIDIIWKLLKYTQGDEDFWEHFNNKNNAFGELHVHYTTLYTNTYEHKSYNHDDKMNLAWQMHYKEAT